MYLKFFNIGIRNNLLYPFLFCLLFAVSVAFGQGYYISQEQMETLTTEILNINESNKNLTSKLQLQQQQYQELQTIYNNKYTLAQEQLETYKSYCKKYENRELIYKYGIAGAFLVGLVVGILVSK